MATTYQIFADFPDHRVTARCIYSISDLLTISLLTYLCGGEDYVDMSEFAHVRARDFNLLTDNDTSPSPDTFERLMSAVCPEELRRCLSEHGRSFLSSLGEKQVAIDGKKLRGASPRTNGTRGDYILSAYVTENHLLVGQESVTDKENEIPAIPRLLDRLDIDEAVVSIVPRAPGRPSRSAYWRAAHTTSSPSRTTSRPCGRPSGTRSGVGASRTPHRRWRPATGAWRRGSAG